MKKNLAIIAISIASLFLLNACGDVNAPTKAVQTVENAQVEENKTENTDVANEETNAPKVAGAEIRAKYPTVVKHEGEHVEGTTLKVAVATDTPIVGVFNRFFSQNAIDSHFIDYTMGGVLPIDGDFKLIANSDETPIRLDFNFEENYVSYKINPKFKWSNGEQFTTADIVKTYEILAHPDFITSAKSVRFDDNVKAIVGIEDYNLGKSDKISGLEVIDDLNMKIHLTEIGPNALWGANFAGDFINAKQFEGVPMDKIIEHPNLRQTPLSYGPYYITSVVTGEKVTFAANEYYYKGVPKVKKVEMEILPPAQQVAAIKSGKYDLVLGTSTDIFPELAELNNISISTNLDLYMMYIGFKLGKWDGSTNVTDPSMKMSDKRLRQAIGYAIDNELLGKQFYHGLRFTANTTITPTLARLHDSNVTGYYYDLDKANALLDEAGYKDVDGDGIREDKEGNPFKINFSMMSGSEVQEPLSQYYMQQWKAIGLDVQLVDGRLLDINTFYDRVQADDPEIDMYVAAWRLASDPNPSGLYGKDAQFNLPRFITPEIEEVLSDISSSKSLDEDFMIKAYHKFEAISMDEVPMIPQLNRLTILPINKRVKFYDNSYSTDFDWSMIELTAKEPIAD